MIIPFRGGLLRLRYLCATNAENMNHEKNFGIYMNLKKGSTNELKASITGNFELNASFDKLTDIIAENEVMYFFDGKDTAFQNSR